MSVKYLAGQGGVTGVATFAQINAAVAAAAQAGGGVVEVLRGTFVEDLAVPAGVEVRAADDGGVVVRGQHVVALGSDPAARAALVGLTLEHDPAGPPPSAPVLVLTGTDVRGRVRLAGCRIRAGLGQSATEVRWDFTDPAAAPLLEVLDCTLAVDPGSAGAPALTQLGPQARLFVRGGEFVGAPASLAIYHASTGQDTDLADVTLRGSLQIDDTGLAGPGLLARLRGVRISDPDPAGGVFAQAGAADHVVEFGPGCQLDVGDGFSTNGVVARLRADLGLSATSRMGTATGGGAEAGAAARPSVARWFGPGFPTGFLPLADFLDLAVVDTTDLSAPVVARLPPLAEQFEGHVVGVRNYGGTQDVIVTGYQPDGDKLDGSAATAVHVDAGQTRYFKADRAHGTWLVV